MFFIYLYKYIINKYLKYYCCLYVDDFGRVFYYQEVDWMIRFYFIEFIMFNLIQILVFFVCSFLFFRLKEVCIFLNMSNVYILNCLCKKCRYIIKCNLIYKI